MAAQIEAAKLMQEANLKTWKNLDQGKFTEARDLTTDLRPQLDKEL